MKHRNDTLDTILMYIYHIFGSPYTTGVIIYMLLAQAVWCTGILPWGSDIQLSMVIFVPIVNGLLHYRD
jgi:hypothetical protein